MDRTKISQIIQTLLKARNELYYREPARNKDVITRIQTAIDELKKMRDS